MPLQEGVVTPAAADVPRGQAVSLDRLCPVGTAARVLQLSRLVQVRVGEDVQRGRGGGCPRPRRLGKGQGGEEGEGASYSGRALV